MPKNISIRLWSPIADSINAYRRRLIDSPTEYYELTWRLIHIEEAIIRTLGMTISSRLLHIYKQSNNNQRAKEVLNRLLNTGCINQGFIDPWINFINFFLGLMKKDQEKESSEKELDCEFLLESEKYFRDRSIQDISLMFIDSWQKIEPSPQFNGLNRVERFRAINYLRNKVAHVPISQKIFKSLHSELRREILITLLEDGHKVAINDDPFSDLQDNFKKIHKVLNGLILSPIREQKTCKFITGSEQYGLFQKSSQISADYKFYFNWSGSNYICFEKEQEIILWCAEPFLYLDNEMKPSLLSRLSDVRNADELIGKFNSGEDIIGEYHRFLAEFEPIQEYLLSQKNIEDWVNIWSFIPENNEVQENIDQEIEEALSSKEIQSHDFDESELPTDPFKVRTFAVKAYRTADYQKAVQFYEKLSQFNDERFYNHTAKKEYGASLWRKANKITTDPDVSHNEFKQSLQILRQATEHGYAEEAAQAFYELSKAQYHYSKKDFVNNKNSIFEESIESARKATELKFSPEYISWLRKVEQENDI